MPDVPDLPGDAGERRVPERGAAGPGRRRDQVVAFAIVHNRTLTGTRGTTRHAFAAWLVTMPAGVAVRREDTVQSPERS